MYHGELNPNYRHGAAVGGKPTSTYRIWQQMVQRCTNPKHKRWRRYGGRGVTVDKRWLIFAYFLEDMGERPLGLSLERENNDLGYSKANCRWATRAEQGANTSQNRMITARGITRHLSAWARIVGTNPSTLRKRLARDPHWLEEH